MWTEKNINAWLAVFFVLLVLGLVYHRDPAFAGSGIGHGIGIAGTFFILMTLVYPFRKRVLKHRGKQNPLSSHITYGLIGPSLAVIHSAHKFSGITGTLIYLTLVLVVLSGIVGRFLYRKANRSLREQKRDLKVLITQFGQRKREIGDACAALEEEAGEGDGVSEYLKKECDRWADEARAIADLEYAVSFFDRTKRLFSRWIRAHHLLTALLFSLLVVHVLTTVYYGLRWLR